MNDNSKTQPDDLTPVMVFPMLNFPIKIMGLNQPEFPVAISELASGHFADFDKGTMTTAPSATLTPSISRAASPGITPSWASS